MISTGRHTGIASTLSRLAPKTHPTAEFVVVAKNGVCALLYLAATVIRKAAKQLKF